MAFSSRKRRPRSWRETSVCRELTGVGWPVHGSLQRQRQLWVWKSREARCPGNDCFQLVQERLRRERMTCDACVPRPLPRPPVSVSARHGPGPRHQELPCAHLVVHITWSALSPVCQGPGRAWRSHLLTVDLWGRGSCRGELSVWAVGLAGPFLPGRQAGVSWTEDPAGPKTVAPPPAV